MKKVNRTKEVWCIVNFVVVNASFTAYVHVKVILLFI